MNLRSKEGLHQFASANEGNVAFLRFQRGGLKQGKYSDWDIAVRDREKALGECLNLFGKPLIRIPRQYVVQHFYDWGQCDLLPVLEWNGIQYLDADTFWGEVKTGDDGLPRPALGHDAYITWMTGLLWGRRFNPRYSGFIAKAASDDEMRFRQCLDEAFGKSLGGDLFRIAERGEAGIATHWVTKMRIFLAMRRFGVKPAQTVRRVLTHWYCEWKFHRNLALPWISFLGPDGSGKSTLIANLGERLRLSRLKMHTIHWIPKLSAHASSEQTDQVVTDPHGEPPKSAFLSLLQLGKIFSFWWFASFRYLFHLRAKKKIIVSDRFYSDLLVDPRRYRYGASLKWARFFFRFLPKPDKVVVLVTSSEKIWERKQEVEGTELERQLRSYQEIASEWGDRAVIIDCGKGADEVADEVLEIFYEALSERSR